MAVIHLLSYLSDNLDYPQPRRSSSRCMYIRNGEEHEVYIELYQIEIMMNSDNQEKQSDNVRSSQSVTRPSDEAEAGKILRDVEKGKVVNAVDESSLEHVRMFSSRH